jgi:hypothetical protein
MRHPAVAIADAYAARPDATPASPLDDYLRFVEDTPHSAMEGTAASGRITSVDDYLAAAGVTHDAVMPEVHNLPIEESLLHAAAEAPLTAPDATDTSAHEAALPLPQLPAEDDPHLPHHGI